MTHSRNNPLGRGARVLLYCFFALTSGSFARAADEEVRFSKQVAPVLVQKCQGCHGPDKAKGNYRVDSFERLLKPGETGSAPVTPGKPEESELFRRVTAHEAKKRMPQKDDPLPPAQVEALERWVRAGAKFDGPDRAAPLASLVPGAQQPHPAAPTNYPRPVPVLALAFAPGGKELAAGGYHEVTFWDPATGALLRRAGGVARQTHALAYSPDGSLLALAGGTPGSVGEVRLIPVTQIPPAGSPPPAASPSPSQSETGGKLLDRIPDVMLAVAFSPDGARLAAGGADGAVRVYDAATGRRLLLSEQHADWVTAVAFSPDGTRVASASRDKSVRVIDAATGEARSAYLGHEAPVFAVAWDAGGRRVYSGGRDREVHAWDAAAEGKKIAEAGGFGGDVLRLAVSGKSLFSCSADGKVRRHDVGGDKPSLKTVQTYEGDADWAYALALDRGAARVAAGGFDGTVRVYSVEDGKGVSTFVAAPGFVRPK